MAEEKTNDKFVEIEGKKFKEDPEREGEPLKDESGNPVPLEEPPALDGAEEKETEWPLVRIPQKDQTPEYKRMGFEIRKLKKEIETLKEGGYEALEPEEDKVAGLREEMDRRFTGLEEKQQSEGLLQVFLSQNPSYMKYVGKIRDYMNHPAYRQVPIGFIAEGIAGKKVALEEMETRKKADEEAAKTKTGGSTNRKTSTEANVWDMSKEEFQKYQDEIRLKGRE